jgi:hypothetical protein
VLLDINRKVKATKRKQYCSSKCMGYLMALSVLRLCIVGG